MDRATRGALRPEARNPESSETVANRLRAAEAAADREEARLWGEVPRGVQVPTTNAKRAAEEMIRTTPRAQRGDIPDVVRNLLGSDSEGGFGDAETVAEMHGLYSELRRFARSAMAGSDQNRNAARIANGVARAILDDLGAYDDGSAIGQAINAARAYSVAKHETFDQGTVGRLLKRTLDDNEMVDPRLMLDTAIGRGGAQALVGYEDLLKAADADPVQNAAEDHFTARFDRAAFGPEGKFNEGATRNFLRDNAEVLSRMPYLRETLDEAIRTQRFAASVKRRASQEAPDSGDPRRAAWTRRGSTACWNSPSKWPGSSTTWRTEAKSRRARP